jgi:hypothetical protein
MLTWSHLDLNSLHVKFKFTGANSDIKKTQFMLSYFGNACNNSQKLANVKIKVTKNINIITNNSHYISDINTKKVSKYLRILMTRTFT